MAETWSCYKGAEVPKGTPGCQKGKIEATRTRLVSIYGMHEILPG